MDEVRLGVAERVCQRLANRLDDLGFYAVVEKLVDQNEISLDPGPLFYRGA